MKKNIIATFSMFLLISSSVLAQNIIYNYLDISIDNYTQLEDYSYNITVSVSNVSNPEDVVWSVLVPYVSSEPTVTNGSSCTFNVPNSKVAILSCSYNDLFATKAFEPNSKCPDFTDFTISVSNDFCSVDVNQGDYYNAAYIPSWQIDDESLIESVSTYALEFNLVESTTVVYTNNIDCVDETFNIIRNSNCPDNLSINIDGNPILNGTCVFSINFENSPEAFIPDFGQLLWFVNNMPVHTGDSYTANFDAPGNYVISCLYKECELTASTEIEISNENSNGNGDNKPAICSQVFDFYDFSGISYASELGEVPVFVRFNSEHFPFDCLSAGRLMEGVIKADAINYKAGLSIDMEYSKRINHMVYDEIPDIIAEANIFESGHWGRWLPEDAYVFRKETDKTQKRNYNHGTFSLDVFNWDNPQNNDIDKWFRTETVTKTSPDGAPLESRNLLGVNSCIVYGYNNTLPVCVAQNAVLGSVSFESFENLSPDFSTQGFTAGYFDNGALFKVSSGAMINTNKEFVHSGEKSLMLGNDFVDVGLVSSDCDVQGEGLIVRLWLKLENNTVGELQDEDILIAFKLRTDETYNDDMIIPLHRTNASGEWMLFSAEITNEQLMNYVYQNDPYQGYFSIGLKNSNLGNVIYVDDFIIQPKYSSVKAYVYNHWLKPVAVFGDQHFAQFFQYDAQGRLIRKQIETERGVKTIEETKYNIRHE